MTGVVLRIQMEGSARLGGHSGRCWRGARWTLALLIAIVATWLSIRRVEWDALAGALQAANLPLLGLGIVTVLATTAAKAIRWQILLAGCGIEATFPRLLRALFIGQLGNSFLPARLGDATRAILVGRYAPGLAPAALGTIVAEKALDGLAGLLVLGALALWTPLPGWARGPLVGLAVMTASLVLLLAVAAGRPTRLGAALGGAARWLPAQLRAQANQLLSTFRLGLSLLRQTRHTVAALALTATVWALAALTNVTVLAALQIHGPHWITWLVLVAVYGATFLPTVPAQVGIFEYACLLALTAAGVAQEAALAFGLLLHLAVYAPPAVLGPLSLAIEGVGWAQLASAARQEIGRSKEGDTECARR